jgi:predicted RNA-binding protein
MCEAAAYLLKEGREELLLESVDVLKSEDGRIILIDIFGEEKNVKATIKSLSLVNHKILLEPL